MGFRETNIPVAYMRTALPAQGGFPLVFKTVEERWKAERVMEAAGNWVAAWERFDMDRSCEDTRTALYAAGAKLREAVRE